MNLAPGNANQVAGMSRRVLLVAFHYPPWAISTGHLRTLAFARHLPTFGWGTAVLTAHPRAYGPCDQGTVSAPSTSPVYRAFALDTRRHLGVQGRYPSLLAIPDRWVSWWPDAVRVGLDVIRKQKIDVIWSTYPIMTSHLVALTLSRVSKLPWVADFRDPVTVDGGWLKEKACRWLERRVIERSTHNTFTTNGARHLYERQFPKGCSPNKFSVIPNGFEEADFGRLTAPPPRSGGPITLVHSGLLYRDGRNPAPFFRALTELKASGLVDGGALQVILRASGNEDEYHAILSGLGLNDIVSLGGHIEYSSALQEQASADGLLLFQGAEFNAQIPVKVYEYLRIGRPIFALTDPRGETALLLAAASNCIVAPLTDEKQIGSALITFLAKLQRGDIDAPDPRLSMRYSRSAGAGELARIFDGMVTQRHENRG